MMVFKLFYTYRIKCINSNKTWTYQLYFCFITTYRLIPIQCIFKIIFQEPFGYVIGQLTSDNFKCIFQALNIHLFSKSVSKYSFFYILKHTFQCIHTLKVQKRSITLDVLKAHYVKEWLNKMYYNKGNFNLVKKSRKFNIIKRKVYLNFFS